MHRHLTAAVVVTTTALITVLTAQISSAQTAENSQESQPNNADDNPFFKTAIPDKVPALFPCHQAGAEIVKLDNIRSFLPSKVENIFTYSLITRDGRNHLIYLGSDTTCRLTVTPPKG